MEFFTLKQIPTNWYKYNVQFSIELLKAFVENIENQVSISITEYENKKETIVIDKTPNEIGSHIIYDVYNGLDSQTWQLDSVYKDYFPNLQRRSAFLSLYGFFEFELEKLCILFKETKALTIELDDLRDRGIDRSLSYLTKVVNLEIDMASNKWEKVKSIQKIRNLYVHNDGKLIDNKGNRKEKENKITTNNEFLKGDNEILISNGYLNYVLESFNDFFKLINDSIQNDFNHTY